MQKLLIINADDFGLSKGVNVAITDLARDNRLTSTTVMANIVEDNDLFKINNLNISVGMHLNLVEGKPVSDPNDVKSLIDEDGYFYPSFKLFTKFALGKIRKNELETEIYNQINFFTNHGVLISHADSHQHTHQFPLLGPEITNCFKKFGIKKVRNCEPVIYNTSRMSVLKFFSLVTHKHVKEFGHTSGLYNYFSIESVLNNNDFFSGIEQCFRRKTCVELMTHPAVENVSGSYLNREREYQFLKEIPIDFFDSLNIKLISYNELY